jgi:hypothetical protein
MRRPIGGTSSESSPAEHRVWEIEPIRFQPELIELGGRGGARGERHGASAAERPAAYDLTRRTLAWAEEMTA